MGIGATAIEQSEQIVFGLLIFSQAPNRPAIDLLDALTP
jgi:hypothetical protein